DGAADASASPLAGPGPACAGTDLFLERCSGGVCHHSGPSPARGLDLLSPAPAIRMVGVASTCGDRLLIDPAAPDESFLLVKVREDAPGCEGARMPNGGDPLAPAEIACLEAWVRDRASAASVVP
ncbi:MAG: nucleotide-binding protein, partial [Deltaproteobacteria bacterium]|nr:nucleotide-binding protein [Deltaproteobacteria bacterium]